MRPDQTIVLSAATVVLLLSACATGPESATPPDDGFDCASCDGFGDRPQYITVAFDGSRSISMWRASMQFARQIENETGKELHYSYFINTPYYLTDPPRNALGVTQGEIPPEEATRRWAYTQLAINEGHEIGSHMVGHYNGSSWSLDRWREEFDMFDDHVRNRLFQPVYGSDNEPIFPRWECAEPLATECDPVFPVLDEDGTELFDASGEANAEAIASGRLVPYVMVGVRAPELGWNEAMLDVMVERGFRYDTSQTGSLDWPELRSDGLWEFPVQMFRRTRNSRSVLGMDYNFLVNDIDGAEVEEMYRNVIDGAFGGDRYPVYFCHHFSTWSGPDGMTYWDALQNAIRYAASQEEVEFPSYIELADRFDGGYERPVTPFIGTSCSNHGDCASVDGGFCVTYGDGAQGFCSSPCERTCPDRSGHATTFCVDSSELSGIGLPEGDVSIIPDGVCVSQSVHINGYCNDIEGMTSMNMERYSDPSRTADVCVPSI